MAKVLLCILDGFGYSDDSFGNATLAAKYISGLIRADGACLLEASGRAVGLPDGQFGNSEVGHLTIGAGTVIKQKLLVINDAIADTKPPQSASCCVDPVLECSCTSEYTPLLRSVSPSNNPDSEGFNCNPQSASSCVEHGLECSCTSKYTPLLRSVSPSNKSDSEGFNCNPQSAPSCVDPVLECSCTSLYTPLLCSVSPSNNPDSEGLRWRSSKLADNEILNNFITQNKVCHLMGLFSAGGVHSSIDHFFWAINFLRTNDVTIRAHLFLDGRDVAYNDALETLRTAIQTGSIRESEIATIQGRFYAMDRDNRIERTQAAYDAIVAGSAELTTDEVIGCIERFYERGIFDEVIPPVIMQPFSGASPEDSFWMLNFRTDRIRQILKMLTDDGRRVLNMVPCGADIDSKASVIFDVPPPQSTLGEILARHGISQLRIAETEKYAHVTYFLNGGSDVKFNLEDRVLIPSPKVKDYSETPAMSSREIASSIIKAMEASSHQVIIANFANADMLGHTGNFEATVESIKILDDCVRDVMECASTNEYIVILTADHGNAEKMLGPDMTPIKTHTCSKVPFVIVPQTDGQFKIPETLADISGIVTEILGA